MCIYTGIYYDFSVIIGSLYSALVWVMNQRFFDRKKPVAFIVLSITGILDSDITLEIIKAAFPGHLSDERSVGAFFVAR